GAGLPNEQLKGTGKKFVADFGAQVKAAVQPYSVYAGQSVSVLLTAIANSNGTRASVAANLLKTKVRNGILGTFTINKNGDTDANPISIHLIKGGQDTTYKVITPPTSLVKKA